MESLDGPETAHWDLERTERGCLSRSGLRTTIGPRHVGPPEQSKRAAAETAALRFMERTAALLACQGDKACYKNINSVSGIPNQLSMLPLLSGTGIRKDWRTPMDGINHFWNSPDAVRWAGHFFARWAPPRRIFGLDRADSLSARSSISRQTTLSSDSALK